MKNCGSTERMIEHLSLDSKIATKQKKLESGLSFELVTSFNPSGDQPKAINELVEGLRTTERSQVLLGATGTGQIVEVFKQLRGEVESSRQVRDATTALTHNVGGSGATCSVHVFGRDLK